MASSTSDMQDVFKEIAKNYDREGRGIPRLFATHIAQLSPAITSTSVIHDNACGPAVVTSELLSRTSITPSRIEATDISPAMISAAREIAEACSWDFVTATQMDATKLTFEDNVFTHSFTNLLVPSQPGAISEVYRTLQPDGIAFYTAWKYHGLVDLWKRCSENIFPDPEAPQRIRSRWTDEAALRGLFEKSGFATEKIGVRVHTELHPFDGIADLAGLVKTPMAKFFTKNWTAEEEDQLPSVLERALTPEEIERQSLEMVAWIVIARK